MIRLDDNGMRLYGSHADLMLDVMEIIKQIYRAIGNQSPEMAEAFRGMLVMSLNDPECPCWSKDWELHEDETLTSIRFGKRRTDD